METKPMTIRLVLVEKCEHDWGILMGSMLAYIAAPAGSYMGNGWKWNNDQPEGFTRCIHPFFQDKTVFTPAERFLLSYAFMTSLKNDFFQHWLVVQ
jgi:hypothetical protein